MSVQLRLLTVNLTANTVAVEFQRLDARGEPEPGRPRHRISLSDELLAAIRQEAIEAISEDIAPLERVPSTLLTSELHRVREARYERAEQERMSRENLAKNAETLDAIRTEHERIAKVAAEEENRLRTIQQETSKHEAALAELAGKKDALEKAEARRRELEEHSASLEAKIAEQSSELDQLATRRAAVLDEHAKAIETEREHGKKDD